jgi:hypothetical protein
MQGARRQLGTQLQACQQEVEDARSRTAEAEAAHKALQRQVHTLTIQVAKRDQQLQR